MATLLGICGVLFVIINVTAAQSACKTPDNWNGNCVALQRCRSLNRMAEKDPSPEQRTFLANSQCGRDGNNVLVCCPNTFTIADLRMPSGRNCGAIVKNKVVGGERAGLTEFPWLALLHYTRPNGRESFSCGGSLIHANYVLTAAHCIRNPVILRLRLVLNSVRLGENDLRSNPDCTEGECASPVDDIPIAEVIVHEKYDHVTSDHDIALIRLERPATFSNNTQPVCLPFGDLQNKSHDGVPMTVAGFGRTESGARSDTKQKVKVNGVNWAECANTYLRGRAIILNRNVICAGAEEGKDSCNGDSGGPLMAEASNKADSFSYQVGIVSTGPAECGQRDFPSIYTRVDKYLDWILDHMKK